MKRDMFKVATKIELSNGTVVEGKFLAMETVDEFMNNHHGFIIRGFMTTAGRFIQNDDGNWVTNHPNFQRARILFGERGPYSRYRRLSNRYGDIVFSLAKDGRRIICGDPTDYGQVPDCDYKIPEFIGTLS